MASVHVPDLKRKFGLLRTYGRYKTLADLAEQFSLKEKTLKWWAGGDHGRQPEYVPEKHIGRLIELFQESLPEGRSKEEVRELVFGAFRPIEEAFLHAESILLSDLIEKEGQTTTARLHRIDGKELVEHTTPPGNGKNLPKICLDELFAIEFRLGSRGGFVAVLQNAQQEWGIVTFADGEISKKISRGSVMFPGNNSNGEITYLFERHHLGIHRFICLVCPDPYPASYIEAARENIVLGTTLLGDLARFYSQASLHRRAIHVLAIEVIETGN